MCQQMEGTRASKVVQTAGHQWGGAGITRIRVTPRHRASGSAVTLLKDQHSSDRGYNPRQTLSVHKRAHFYGVCIPICL